MDQQTTVEDEDTVEVDPNELSDEIVEGLVEEGAFEEEEAEKYGDKVWFEEVDTPEPTKKEGFLEKVARSSSKKYKSWKKRSAFIKLKSVVRTDDDRIRINLFHHEHGERTVVFSPESSVLGNIMALAGVSNPKDLEGGRLLMTEGAFNHPDIVVPNNLSTYGQMKYKSYSYVKHIQEKTEVRKLNDDFIFGSIIVTLISWMPALIAPLVIDYSTILASALTLPAIILTSAIGIMGLYYFFRFILFIFSGILRGESSEVSTDR